MNAEFIAAIEAALQERQPHREAHELRFLCPAHSDRNPSARWHPEKHVWRCDVCGEGGGAIDLVRRLGIDVPNENATGVTLAQLAEAKGLPVEFLASLGMKDATTGYGSKRVPCVEMPYVDATGTVSARRKRISVTGADKSGRNVVPP